jgi:hypothetical protein
MVRNTYEGASWVLLLTKYYPNYQIEENETCGQFWCGELKEKSHLEDLDVEGNTINTDTSGL